MVPVNCEEFQKNVHPLLDGELSDEMADAMRTHMAACADCREEYEQLASVRDMLAHMDDDLETPVEFERGWRKAVREEHSTRRTRGWVRTLSGVAAGFILLAGATVINRMSGNMANMTAQPTAVIENEYEVYSSTPRAMAVSLDGESDALPTEYALMATAESDDEAADAVQPKYSYSNNDALGATSSGGILDVDGDSGSTSMAKRLRSATLNIDTGDFDNDLSEIKNLLTKYGGLIERNAISGENGSRIAELTLRVPAGFLESFVEQMRGIGSVTRSEVSAQDVSSQYSDTALRLDTYRTQLNRVKELTSSASDLNEVLELEAEASRLQYEIDKLTGALKGWDNQAEMSTVNVVLSEYTHMDAGFSASTFGDQLGEQFSESMSNVSGFFGDMMLTATALLPYLMWIVPLGLLTFFGIKLFKKDSKRRHADGT